MRYLISLLLLLFAVALGACGDDDDDDAGVDVGEQTTTRAALPSVAEPAAQPAPAQALDRTATEPQDGVTEISVEAGLFVGNLLAVPIDEAVTIRVTNGDSATHNLRVAGNDGVFETEDDAVTTPDAITMGSIGELSFAPPVAGYFTFRCDFHPNTMGGQIVAGDPSAPAVTQPSTPSPTPAESETPVEGTGGGEAPTP